MKTPEDGAEPPVERPLRAVDPATDSSEDAKTSASGEEVDAVIDPSDSPAVASLKGRLAELREEHRALDAAIVALQEQAMADALQVARLKKRKLALRDQIEWVQDRLRPDIIA